MPIAPPGQIGLDLRPPALPELASARAGLTRGPGNAAAAAFDAGIGDAKAVDPAAGTATPETFRRFEAMVLQTFIQSMLPEDTESVYGGGMAGQMWQAMLAEQLGAVIAERGGIGIADRILRDHYVVDDRTVALQGVSADPSLPEREEQRMLSVALVQEIQRKLANSLSEDRSAASAGTGTS